MSVTEFHAGSTYNVIAEDAMLRGTVRSFSAPLRKIAEERLRAITTGIAAANGGRAEIAWYPGYPALVNDAEPLERAFGAAASVAGRDRVDRATPPIMGGEDFAYMLEAKPGAFVFIGAGPASTASTSTK